jgi:chromosome condensin MukBEF ATPase and DNA-binding subunit MukB
MGSTTSLMPESADARIARLEGSRDEHREQIRQVTPLVAQYAVLEERLGNVASDLTEGLKAIRAELVEMKKDQQDRAKERRTMLIALFVAGIGLFGTFVATAVPLIKGSTPAAQERSK